MIALCRKHIGTLPDMGGLLDETIEPHLRDVRARLFAAASTGGKPGIESPATSLRAEVNDLVNRLAATVMTLAKGSGFVTPHPAQRLVREAMFMNVWSATAAVRAGTLTNL